MKYPNVFEFKVYGDNAMFSDPISKAGGEKTTMPVPTYEALKNIAKSIYWKPTFTIIVDEVKLLNRINTESKGVRTMKYNDGASNDLSIYTYLTEPAYAVRCHFEWNLNHPELERDRNEDKHFQIMKRCIEKGGRRNILLGVSECTGDVEPCKFDDEKSPYEQQNIPFGLMYHGITYADEAVLDEDRGQMTVRFQQINMKDGIIKFLRPEECTVKRHIRPQEIKLFDDGRYSEVDETFKEVMGNELD